MRACTPNPDPSPNPTAPSNWMPRSVNDILTKFGLQEAMQDKFSSNGGPKGRRGGLSNHSEAGGLTVKIPDSLKGKIPVADNLDTKPKNTFEKEATKRSSGEVRVCEDAETSARNVTAANTYRFLVAD